MANLTVKEFMEKVEQNIGLVMKAAAFKVYRKVILRTPVDTGRARASWNITTNTVNGEVRPPGEYTAFKGSSPAMGIPDIGFVAIDDTVNISNNLPYIAALNDGHSIQAPPLFVEAAVETVRAEMDLIVRGAVGRV